MRMELTIWAGCAGIDRTPGETDEITGGETDMGTPAETTFAATPGETDESVTCPDGCLV